MIDRLLGLCYGCLRDSARPRERYVRLPMLDELRYMGISDERVLTVMARVPRERFLPPEQRIWADLNRPLPIGYGQTISQPFIVARMTELLDLRGEEKVLEIGTGSGYQAAILSMLAREVWTIEIWAPLADLARGVLTDLGCENIHYRVGDGWEGWPEEAPFDAVIITAAPEYIPDALLEQLADGGRLVLPVGRTGEVQMLQRVWKHGGEIEIEDHGGVVFVPMVKATPASESE